MQPSPLSERAIDRERMSRDPAPSLCRAASQEALGIGPDCRRLGSRPETTRKWRPGRCRVGWVQR